VKKTFVLYSFSQLFILFENCFEMRVKLFLFCLTKFSLGVVI
jgi:hypothetical protein